MKEARKMGAQVNKRVQPAQRKAANATELRGAPRDLPAIYTAIDERCIDSNARHGRHRLTNVDEWITRAPPRRHPRFLQQSLDGTLTPPAGEA
jgi:hypothetical protein